MNSIKKLDKIFSIYIRMRDADENGICTCIACGQRHYWKLMDAGHFVNRRYMGLRFSETNVNSECRYCNRFDEGNPVGYMEGLKAKYGKEIIDKLMIAKKEKVKYTKFEIETMIDFYQQKIKKLEDEN